MQVKYLSNWGKAGISSVHSWCARILLLLALVSWLPSSWADLNAVNMGSYTLSGPVDQQPINQPIIFQSGVNAYETTQGTVFSWFGCWNIRGEAWSDAPRVPGLTVPVNGISHRVFQIPQLPGIGYVIDVKDPKASVWKAINDTVEPPSTVPGYRTTYESPLFGLCSNIGLSVRVTLIKLGRVPVVNSSQVYTISNFLSFRAWRTGLITGETLFQGPSTTSLSFTLRSLASSCRMTGASNQNISLPEIGTSQLPAVGSTFAGNSNVAQFSLQCDPGVTLYATLNDANSPSNTSDVLTNTGTAKGVGVQLLQTSASYSTSNCANGTPCRFGPDSTLKGTTNQWQIGPSNTGNAATTNPYVTFQARYIRTGAVQVGTVRAVSTITFSYQ